MIKQKNLKALKECRPELYAMATTKPQTTRYQVVSSNHARKIPNLLDKSTGRLYYDNFDPLESTRKSIIERKILLPNLSFFIGMGLLYNLMGFQSLFTAKNCCYIIVERDPEVFYHIIENIDIETIIRDNRVKFFIGYSSGEIYPHLYNILNDGNNKSYTKAINFIEEPTSFSAHKDYYIGLVRTLNEAIREVILLYGNDPLDSLIGIDHTFVNINEIIDYPGIDQLKGKFTGRPGIVVATGPSLNKNVHLLKGLQDKAVICSVDASVRVLKKHGLKPHLTTSLERVVATSKLFEGLTEEDLSDVYFAACPVVHPLTYANFKGERIVVYRNFATFKWLDIPKGTLDIGPSSANMSFKVLEYMGCNPIILIGQDLAFGEDDLTHASGSTFGEQEKQYSEEGKVLTVEGNYQPQIKTSIVWDSFRKFYMKDVAEFNGKVINATEGGAKIHGTEIMTFAEAIEKYVKTQSPIDIVNEMKATLVKPSKEERFAHYRKALKKVDESISFCNFTIKEIHAGYEASKEYEEKIITPYLLNNSYDDALANALLSKIEKSFLVINEPLFQEILMHYVQSYVIKTIIEINGVKSMGDVSNIEKNNAIVRLSKDMYGVLVELIKRMVALLIILKEKLENSVKELT
jgi:hypothetical protein